ncbi:hypothetical protein AB1L42_07860 [Thalassoglobus sp. JC818]|uniref:hypothetical protein n=1 Tax=Thalassoglobus sp. JC818 TaxID=3232136 RepID=UPI003457FA11
MNPARDPELQHAPKWLKGRGLGPRMRWHSTTDGSLEAMAYARETGDLFLADATGTLSRVDRHGQIASITHLHSPPTQLSWSDDGNFGAALCGEDLILRFDRNLKVVGEFTPSEIPLAIAISPFGNHLAVSYVNATTTFYNERRRKIGRFETLRPLAFLRFCPNEPILFGAAEHGLVCCFNLSGAEIWREKNWSNVGGLRLTGDGDLVYLASFAHGVEVYDGDGASVGSYVLDGTVHRLDASYEPNRLIVSTVEGALYWLDADGELLWSTTVSDDVVDLVCDPFGEWAYVGLGQEGVYSLEWRSESAPQK